MSSVISRNCARHIPDALSLGVEQELVVAAVRTDRNDSALALFQRHKCMESLRDLKLGETHWN